MRAFVIPLCLFAAPVLAETGLPLEGSQSYQIRSEGVTVMSLAFRLQQSNARIALCGAGWLEVDSEENADLLKGFLARTNITVETLGAEVPEVLLLRADTSRFATYRSRDEATAGGLSCVETDYRWDPKFDNVKIDILTEPDPAE